MAIAQLFSWEDAEHLGAPDRLLWGRNPTVDIGPLPMAGDHADLATQANRAIELRLNPLAKPQQTRPRRIVSGAGAGPGWTGNLPAGRVVLAVGGEAAAPVSNNPLGLFVADGLVHSMALQIQAAMRQEDLSDERTSFTAWCRATWVDPDGQEQQALYHWPGMAEVSTRGDAPIIGVFSILPCVKGIELWAAYPTTSAGEPAPFAITSVDLQIETE